MAESSKVNSFVSDGFVLTPVVPKKLSPQEEAWRRVFEEEDQGRKNPSTLTTAERYMHNAKTFGNHNDSSNKKKSSKTNKKSKYRK